MQVLTKPAEGDVIKHEAQFNELLYAYFGDAGQAAQFVYAYLAIHALAGINDDVRRGLNNEALFWNTVLGSLQTSLFIVLGRVFDPNNQYGPYAVLRAARSAPEIFSFDALAERKRRIFGDDQQGLANYMADIKVPTKKHFSRLQGALDGYKKIFDDDYRDLRSKVFAHKVYAGKKVSDLFSRTNIDDLQRMVAFLGRFFDAWSNTYENGNRLVLRRRRRSVNEMLAKPRGKRLIKPIEEEIVAATARVLESIAIPSPIDEGGIRTAHQTESPGWPLSGYFAPALRTAGLGS
jgi:hypothetical protein